MRHVELVTISTAAPEGGWAASKPEHGRAVEGVIFHPKEKMVEEVSVDTTMPVCRGKRERVFPHVERHLQVLLVVEVEVLQHAHRTRRGETDCKTVGALCPIGSPNTEEDVGGGESKADTKVDLYFLVA